MTPPHRRLAVIRNSLWVAYTTVCAIVFSAIVVAGVAVYIHLAIGAAK